ncbi:hypothetical protein QPK87_31300 [Kamptonema cortianum]|nr:hypothetical protein [Geitlerinema splendidum]MDK3161011.1 hypothetical protein [Kamptonema cortianum]
MRKLVSILVAALLVPVAFSASSQSEQAEQSSVRTSSETVSISAKGEDIRDVLYDLFTQSKKNFVLDANVTQSLYLNLEGLTFQKALDAIALSTQIGYEVQGDIYFIGRNRPLPLLAKSEPKLESSQSTLEAAQVVTEATKSNEGSPTVKQDSKVVEAPPLAFSGAEDPKAAKTGRLPQEVLNRKLTTRLSMAEIKQVFNEFGKQTGVLIEIDPAVPAYKIDAFLLGTSLKYALDVICDATKLEWSFTDKMTIKIAPRK